jgi:hypothetical protein
MKKCSRCKELKDDNEFGKRLSSKDGLDSWCLKCNAERAKLSRAKNKSKHKNAPSVSKKICPTCRLEKNANEFGTNTQSKDGLRNECRDCRNVKARRRYATDPDFRESESIRAAQIYIKDRDRLLNRSKKWSKDNPEKKIGQRHRRVARLHGQIIFDVPINFIEILRERQNNMCAYCSIESEKLTVEHMLPISRGGKHRMDNIVLACTTCNFSKHNKTLEEWLVHNQKLQQAGIVSDSLIIICDNLKKLLGMVK